MNFYREIELLSVDIKSPIELNQSPAKIAEIFLKETGQKKMAEDAIASHDLLKRLIEQKQNLMAKGIAMLRNYSEIQKLYPKSSIVNHRSVFWHNALVKLSGDMTASNIGDIKESHDMIVQSEDSSINGSRQRLIKAKNGYLCSAIDEPREGTLQHEGFLARMFYF